MGSPIRAVRPLLGVLVVLLALLAPHSPAVAGQSWRATDSATQEEFADRILTLVNQRRAAHDLRPLALHRCVDRFATRWADRLVDEDRWEHSNLKRLAQRCEASYVAENLASWQRGTSPREVVRMWMRSDGHRHNILSPKARLAGVSVRWDDNRRRFYAVLDFARIP